MKKCPVCNANCFDDMEVCFGCMHHFAEDEASRTPIIAPRFVPVIADVPEVIEEPPARMEPTPVEFVQTELMSPVPAQAEHAPNEPIPVQSWQAGTAQVGTEQVGTAQLGTAQIEAKQAELTFTNQTAFIGSSSNVSAVPVAQADAARGKHAHEATPSAPQLAKVCGATRSGRAALHRRAASPSYARLTSGYSPAHAVVVSGEAAQYKLVVSLQPMGNLEL